MNDKIIIAGAAVLSGAIGYFTMVRQWWVVVALFLVLGIVSWVFRRDLSPGIVENKIKTSWRRVIPFILLYAITWLTLTFSDRHISPSVALAVAVLWGIVGAWIVWATLNYYGQKPVDVPADSPPIVQELARAGATDGTLLKIWRLAKVLEIPEEQAVAQAKELARQGRVSISTLGNPHQPGQWMVQLT